MVQPLPKISVITPCFNSKVTIRETLQSAADQHYPDIEHLVIDGGSTDGTIEILKQAPGVTWLSEKDGGIYDAMNKGIRRARGEIVGILNSDDRYPPGALLKVGHAFATHAEWDALFGDVIFIDAAGREIYRRHEAKYDYDVLRLSGACYVVHPTLFVRARVYQKLGLYRHQEYLRCADYDFILQLGRNGCTVGHLREFLAEFRYHSAGQSSDLRVLASMDKERERLLAEYGAPHGSYGRLLRLIMQTKRQLQKLFYRGRLDFQRGDKILKHYRHKEGKFSTNIPMESI